MAVRMLVVPSFVLAAHAIPSSSLEHACSRSGSHDRAMTPRLQATSEPSSSADVVLVGRLGAHVEVRELPSGDTVTVFTIVVDRPRTAGRQGSTVKVDAIACQAFRAAVVNRLGRLEPGQWVRAEGALRRRFWRSGAGLGSAMEVEVSRLQAAG
jgi:single-strand DNA-binding protein